MSNSRLCYVTSKVPLELDLNAFILCSFSSSKMDPITAHRLAVKMDNVLLDGRNTTTFWYQLVVERTYSFNDLLFAMCAKFPWKKHDIVEVCYWDNVQRQYVPLRTDDKVGLMFVQNISTRFGKLAIKVVQNRRVLPKGKGNG